MVSDPAWFPSAAMQTLGAMYAIFVAIYVLVLQKRINDLTSHMIANLSFVVLSIIVGITIILNASVLYRLCTPYVECSTSLYDWGFFTFVLSIIYILLLTIYLSIIIAQRGR